MTENTDTLSPVLEDQVWSDWAAEQRADQAKRWAIVAVITANDNDGVVLNYGSFEPFALEGVGTWCSDEGLEVPKLEKGVYYVSNIGIRADEEDFEAWGEWALVAPLAPDIAKFPALLTALEEAEGREHLVCAGCGSSRSMAELKAGGHVSCCPERKMLTAKEWAARAEKAEQMAEQRQAIIAEFLQHHDEGPGLIDCIDNRGDRYTSAGLDAAIRRARALSPNKSEADSNV